MSLDKPWWGIDQTNGDDDEAASRSSTKHTSPPKTHHRHVSWWSPLHTGIIKQLLVQHHNHKHWSASSTEVHHVALTLLGGGRSVLTWQNTFFFWQNTFFFVGKILIIFFPFWFQLVLCYFGLPLAFCLLFCFLPNSTNLGFVPLTVCGKIDRGE